MTAPTRVRNFATIPGVPEKVRAEKAAEGIRQALAAKKAKRKAEEDAAAWIAEVRARPVVVLPGQRRFPGVDKK